MRETNDTFQVVVQNITRMVENNLVTTGSRPDWVLIVVPSITFAFGVLLFSLIFRTQRRKEKALKRVAALKTIMGTASTAHTYTSKGPTAEENKELNEVQNSTEALGNFTKQAAQSYENVTTVIYNNEDKVNYCILQEEDYVTPDAEEETDTNYLQPLQNLTDTDGESYENMEGCVYAHPRQPTLKNALSSEDNDYVHPDGESKCNLEQTDTESYENMAGSAYTNTETYNTNTHTVDEGCYEDMDRRQTCEGHT